ncbi:MAG: aminotransferase class IV [Bacteroidales bacterium]
MSECYGNYFVRNGELIPSCLFNNTDVYEGESVYEVLRMMGSGPLFFEDHMERMAMSVQYHDHKMLATPAEMASQIIMMRKSAGVKEANLKIVFNYKENENTCLLYFIEPLYPTHKQYREGVQTILYRAERENPEVKVINHRLRSSIYHRLIISNAYEALLVDSDGYVTEGSRSNIFFVKEGKLFTAPDEKVLGGITRKQVLDICRQNGIEVVMGSVHEDDIVNYESVFMTGTSPMVLPIKMIDEMRFRVDNPLVRSLLELYTIRVKESLAAFRRPGSRG